MLTFNSNNVTLNDKISANVVFNKVHEFTKSKLTKVLFMTVFALGLSACSDNDTIPPVTPPVVEPEPEVIEYGYTIEVTNLTYAQPLSPIAVLLHGDEKLWSAGEEASEALEKLAEGGDNADFIALDSALAAMSSDEPVGPGSSTSISISTTDDSATFLTVATMLVNTNDAFTGLTGIDISAMEVDDNKSWNLNVYDAGTEADNEEAGTIPGPADGGEGYNEARDDVDFISLHSGVVSQDDGLTNSVLTQAHRFDNPAIKLTITRTN
jgi:hypothetical protein